MKMGFARDFWKLLKEKPPKDIFISLQFTQNEHLNKIIHQGFCFYSKNSCMLILSFTKHLFFRTTPDGSYFLPLHRSFFIFLDLFDSNRVLEENLGLNLMSQCRPYIRNTYYVVISFIQNFEATQWKCWCNVLKSTSSGRCEFNFTIWQLCQRCHYTIYDILWCKLAIHRWGNVDRTF